MPTEAWDCDLFHVHAEEPVDLDIDEEGDDWQQIILDRFHDRLVRW